MEDQKLKLFYRKLLFYERFSSIYCFFSLPIVLKFAFWQLSWVISLKKMHIYSFRIIETHPPPAMNIHDKHTLKSIVVGNNVQNKKGAEDTRNMSVYPRGIVIGIGIWKIL